MKIVLTGSTGFIGKEVLRQCQANVKITSIITLVRKEIPDLDDLKVKQIIMKDDDFMEYPASVREAIRDADGCVWALGSVKFPNDEVMRRVSVDYNRIAASEFSTLAASSGKKVHFVYLSGALVVRDQSESIWIAEKFRKARGDGETVLIDKTKENPVAFQATIAKPAFVLGRTNVVAGMMSVFGYSIRVDELAAALVDCALNGSQKETLDNKDLLQQGRAYLKQN